MEMKIYLEWGEIVICLLLIAFPLFLIVTTVNDTNQMGWRKDTIDQFLTSIESKAEESSDKDIQSDLPYFTRPIRNLTDEIYYAYKNAVVKMICLIIMFILGTALWTNQQRKYEQKITQLEWALKEEKEKLKER